MTDTPRLTDEQATALSTRDVSVALDAGAGCGKTFVLTERFLSHLDPTGEVSAPDLDQVIAITFTEAAAREMRDRVRKKCRERLEAAGGKEAEQWRRLLRSLDAARVTTIHSFCSSLVRRHAVELGIDPAFRVIDGPTAGSLRDEAVDDAIRAALWPPGGEIDQEVVEAAAEWSLRNLRSAVAKLVQHAYEPGFAVWAERSPRECVAAWLGYYHQKVAPRYAEELIKRPEVEEMLRLIDLAEPQTPGLSEHFSTIRGLIEEARDSQAPHQTLQRLASMLKSQRTEGGKRKNVWNAKDWSDSEDKKRFTAVCGELRTLLDKQKHPGEESSQLRTAEIGLLAQRLALGAERLYRGRKLSAGVLDQDDLLKEAYRLLKDPAFIDPQRQLREAIHALLVDEFQDTDRLQTDIVLALVGDGAEEPVPEGGKLFFVGDAKQSIYRFRGAEPEVFEELRLHIPERGRLPLSRNFRSQPGVIEFVNALFEQVFENYLALQPTREQTAPRPSVEFLFSEPPQTEQDSNAKVDELRRRDAQCVAARLRALIDSGEPVVADGETARGARPGDVAILLRTNHDMRYYEEALRDARFDSYIAGGMAFYALQEVLDVANLLRTVDNPCDEVSLLGVLRSPFFGLHDETLYRLSLNGGLAQGLFNRDPHESIQGEQLDLALRAKGVLKHLRVAKSQTPVAELLQTAVDLTGFDAVLLAEFLGHRKFANLEKLIERARQNDAAGLDLTEQLRQLTTQIATPPKEPPAATSTKETDAVRLMTVHYAKGLEFPIVVVPDLDHGSRSDTTIAVYDPDLGPMVRLSSGEHQKQASGVDFYSATQNEMSRREDDRLFYVACTRAADRLILSACAKDLDKPAGHWLTKLSERFDLRTGVLRDGLASEDLVEVIDTSGLDLSASATQEKRADLLKTLDSAEQIAKKSKQPWPNEVAPIALSTEGARWLSVSRLTGKLYHSAVAAESDRPTSEGDERVDPLALGTLVHAVVERLDPVAGGLEEQIDRWSDSLAPLHEVRHADTAAVLAKELVSGFVQTERWRAMAGSQDLRREVEFLLPWPPASAERSASIHGYIDALYQDPDGAWRVVDYKTNRVDVAGVPQLAEQYRLQMSVYALATELALGVAPRSMTLCFLRPGVEHTFVWDKPSQQLTIEMVRGAISEVDVRNRE